MKKTKKRKLICMLLLLFILIFIFWGFKQTLQVSYYTYKDSSLPTAFDNYRIVFISDFHCKEFGTKEDELITKITECNPDLIVLTGDMIDSGHPDLAPVTDLLSGISSICPIYAISGNHEFDSKFLFDQLKQIYAQFNVTFLDDSFASITIDNQSIGLYGARYQGLYYTDHIINHSATNTEFNILLAHDATNFEITGSFGYNLVLSGHTHGGIIRLPFIGGLINNDGSLFSRYDSGAYKLNNTTLISNRGLGDSRLPRFFNNPEIICITLKTLNK